MNLDVLTPPTPPATPFPIGAKVRLKACPDSVGQVLKMGGHRVLVRWVSLGYIGNHRAQTLELAPETEQ